MPKRKRDDESLDALFLRSRTDLFHALKAAKGFERQRQSKRLADHKTAHDKRARIDAEILVLKSLDLQQTAHAHLCSSLLRVKAIAESERLPAEVKAGVPKPELSEEERAALHNVTSSLYNRVEVKRVVEKAVGEVCKALGIAVPERGKGAKGKEKGGKKDERIKDEGESEKASKVGKQKKSGKDKAEQASPPEDEQVDEEEEEKAIFQLDKLLGLGSDDEDNVDEEELLLKGRTKRPTVGIDLDPMEITTDEEGGDEEEEVLIKGRAGKRVSTAELDPMEITTDEEGGDDDSDQDSDLSDSNSDDDEAEFNGFSDDDLANQSSASDDEDDASSTSSTSRSPPAKKPTTAKKPSKNLKPTDSTFLPSLMGGYISGSESASDLDDAPVRKNRRGQRARQATWEKKYGEKAKHLVEPKGRDAGWDMKRGAIGGGDGKPWKQGIRNPLAGRGGSGKGSGANDVGLAPPKKERVRDDVGALHPSWAARKELKAREQLTAPFQGKKITFD
ncbi:Bud-site selection protein [Staphylotrichum tortipilum]|uniref:Bud-site selection protein n=1 Tax=Staphylotrichum tortipilum TaxID=2831512 RepID=A0AAN6RR54_9PEZI|nr:Bud-site selection protein [Staphylotrichum longicolle]